MSEDDVTEWYALPEIIGDESICEGGENTQGLGGEDGIHSH